MKRDRINNWAANFGMNVIIRYRYIFLASVVFMVVIGFLGMQRLITDTSNESFLPENDEMIIQNDRFKEIFGNEEFAFILIESEEVFSHDTLEYVKALSEDFDKNLPFARKVTSLTNVEYMDARDDILQVEDLIGHEIPTDRASLEEIKRKTLSSRMYVDRIVTRDSKNTGIFITFEKMPEYVYAPVSKKFNPLDEANWPGEKVLMRGQLFTEEQAKQQEGIELNRVRDPRKLIAPAVKAIIQRHENPDYKVIPIGIPIFDYEGEVYANSEGVRLGMIAMLVAVAFLVAIFRGFRGVVAPIIVVIATIIITYGIMGWAGMVISSASGMIPTLLLVISVSYSIHVINHFRQSFRRTGLRGNSVRYSFKHAAWPCFMTALTTSVGFASFIIVPMAPIRNVGIACSVGAFIAYLLVIAVVPSLLSFGKDKMITNSYKNVEKEILPDSRLMAKWAGFVSRHSMAIGVLFTIIFLAAILLSFRIRVETNFLEMLGDKVEMARDAKYVVDRMGGMYSYEMLIELPEDGMAKEPLALQAIEAIDSRVKSMESTSSTSSLNDVVKELNWVMHNKDDNYYSIPDSRDLIAQYLLLYEMSGGEGAEDMVDYDYRIMRMSVQVNEHSTAHQKALDGLKVFAESKLPSGTKTTIVGDIPILLKLMGMLTNGQIKSTILAFMAISVMMILVLRSFWVGWLSMIPNVFPVIITMGAMGLLKIPLDFTTIMIAPMIIGIAVDDTIHYFIHFRQEFKESHSYTDANRRTFQRVGYAMVFTSVVLIFGFSIFCFSPFKSMFYMGVVSSLGIFSAIVADMFITPVLLVHLKPFGKVKKAQLIEEEAFSGD